MSELKNIIEYHTKYNSNKELLRAIEQYVERHEGKVVADLHNYYKQYVIKARIENSKYLLSVVWSKLKQTDCLEDYFFTAKEILDIFEGQISKLKKEIIQYPIITKDKNSTIIDYGDA